MSGPAALIAREPLAGRRLIPLAAIHLTNSGPSFFRFDHKRDIDPHLVVLLEVLAHHSERSDILSVYSQLVGKSCGKKNGPLLDYPGRNDENVLTFCGSAVLLSDGNSAARAWQMAAATYHLSLGRGSAADRLQHRMALLRTPTVENVSALSRDTCGVGLSALLHFGSLQNPLPMLSEAQLNEAVAQLRSEALLVPFIGSVDLGDGGSFNPLCPNYGFTRGTPVDRFYLRKFLREHARRIGGETLDIGGQPQNLPSYAAGAISSYKTLDLDPAANADIIADIHDPSVVPRSSFDTVLAFNVLEHCAAPFVVASNIALWLKPGGKVLCLTPCTQRLHRDPEDYWRLLPAGLGTFFKGMTVLQLRSYGNLVAAQAALLGIAAEELSEAQLTTDDAYYPVVACIVAQKD